jgi:hypothetical protein
MWRALRAGSVGATGGVGWWKSLERTRTTEMIAPAATAIAQMTKIVCSPETKAT